MNEDVGIVSEMRAQGVIGPGRSGDRIARWLLGPLTVAFMLIVGVFYVFFSAGQVEGQSMLPTLRTQDRVLLTHGYPDPVRGDIVSVRVAIGSGEDDIIKRVIAIPGDTVRIRADVAYVNGKVEPQRGQVIMADVAVDVAEQVVPEGTLYLMGDNRADSEDSRFIGPVPESGVRGKAVAIFSPVNRIRLLH